MPADFHRQGQQAQSYLSECTFLSGFDLTNDVAWNFFSGDLYESNQDKIYTNTITNNMSSNIRISKACEYCKQLFTAKTIHTRYCSHTCNRKAYKGLKRKEKIDSVTRPSIPTNPTIPPIPQIIGTDYIAISKKEFLTINEACLLLNITSVTLRRWIKSGIVPTQRIGKKHIIKRKEIDRLLR